MDRVLALLLRLRYRQVVTVKRVRVAVFLFWLTGGVVGFIYVWSFHLFFTVSGVLVFLFVVISTFSYTKYNVNKHKYKMLLEFKILD